MMIMTTRLTRPHGDSDKPLSLAAFQAAHICSRAHDRARVNVLSTTGNLSCDPHPSPDKSREIRSLRREVMVQTRHTAKMQKSAIFHWPSPLDWSRVAISVRSCSVGRYPEFNMAVTSATSLYLQADMQQLERVLLGAFHCPGVQQ